MKWFKRSLIAFLAFPCFFMIFTTLCIVMMFAKGSEDENFDSNEVIKLEGDYVGPFEDKNFTITSDVGSRPLDGDHKGIDLVRSYGSKIVALTDASVYYAKSYCEADGGYLGNWCPFDENAGGGNYVVLAFDLDGKKYYVTYAHMSEINVQKGQAVAKGQVIGKQGNSGNSTGSHLHVEIHYGGLYAGTLINWVNPRTFLDI